MNIQSVLSNLNKGVYKEAFSRLYGGSEKAQAYQTKRYIKAVESFSEIFPTRNDINLYSAPGRTEIGGNHTDHQQGSVLAGAVNLDAIAIVSFHSGGCIRLKSEGFDMIQVDLADTAIHPGESGDTAIVRGIVARFKEMGVTVEGFDAYTTSDVIRGGGISSSAAFEILVCTIINEHYILHRQAIDYPRIVKPQIQAYDDDEARIFFNGLKEESPQIRALLMTSLLLGLRRGEVVGLMWSDINFKAGSMYISRSAYKTKGQPQALKPPKSQSSVRTVFFSEAYAEVLLAWREEQVEQRIKASRSWNEQGFVFTNEFGNMINICLPTEICSQFEEKCGLRHLKLHGLRHTCGSLMIKNGVDIETVKSVFGHENIRTTQQYLTAYDSAKKRAADALAACIMN